MQIKIKYRRSIVVLVIIAGTVSVLTHCVSNEGKDMTTATKTEQAITFESYISSEKCMSCHKEIYENHIKTAHYLTGKPASEEAIRGSFQKGKNTYSYTPDILLSMQKRDSGLFQVVYFKGDEKKAMRFDMVIGSGVMGQSFLTWRNDQLYQLPITYFAAADQWSNSPGFPNDKVLIDRPATSRCLECHISYAEGISGPALEPTGFARHKIIYGVDCQKCHGPAAKHVDHHTQHPQDTNARYIVNPAKLSRQQQLDICTLCHGGNIQKTKPSFEFTAGKNLSDYFSIESHNNVVLNSSEIDVHGNQVGLLKASKCFRLSQAMTCSTCHNTHENERGKTALFSQRCINCHRMTDDKLKTATHLQVSAIEKNCIDCHMPVQPSKSIAVFLQGEETPRTSKLRSHYIGIYEEEIKKFINNNK
ncbi:MAG TPA: cytochrome c3 family protein [Chitinophagaceae bacterium]|nr:cytochrome c3 family protein [Chitinophagaceae bacterium]